MSEIRLGLVLFLCLSFSIVFYGILYANLVEMCSTEVAFCSSYFQKIFSKTQIIGNTYSFLKHLLKEPLTAFVILFFVVSVFNQTKSSPYVQSSIKCSIKSCSETYLKNSERKISAQGFFQESSGRKL